MPSTKVKNVEMLSSDILELTLERDGIGFTPGDCVAISNTDGISRPYSVSSAVHQKTLRFVIRRIPGGIVSDWIARRTAGDTIEISHPFGWFRPGQSKNANNPCVFIATGTGIAPFLSVLQSYNTITPEYCLYGVRKESDAIKIPYLQTRCPTTLCVSGHPTSAYHHGRVTDLLKKIPISLKTDYYLCGLDSMIDEVRTWLEQNSIHFSCIHQEVFFNA